MLMDKTYQMDWEWIDEAIEDYDDDGCNADIETICRCHYYYPNKLDYFVK